MFSMILPGFKSLKLGLLLALARAARFRSAYYSKRKHTYTINNEQRDFHRHNSSEISELLPTLNMFQYKKTMIMQGM